jgi:hypothetical protein
MFLMILLRTRTETVRNSELELTDLHTQNHQYPNIVAYNLRPGDCVSGKLIVETRPNPTHTVRH